MDKGKCRVGMLGEGKIYRRRDLHAKLGGQQQSGISTPSQYPVIMIFSGESGKNYGYKDGWQENDVYYYTGEGQEGDMKFIKGNKAIRDHLLNGKDIWLFGGASLTTSLMNAGLVDRLWLSVHPIVVGQGKPLFAGVRKRIKTKLIEVKPYDTGLVSLSYEVLN